MLMLFFFHLNIKIKPRPCLLEVKKTCYQLNNLLHEYFLIDFFFLPIFFMWKLDRISCLLLRSVLGMQSHMHLGPKNKNIQKKS